MDGTYPIGSNCVSNTNDYDDDDLEGLNFIITFANQTNNNYIYIPLESLAYNATATGLGVYCTNTTTHKNTVILGTSFFNNFIALFKIDLTNPFND